MDNFPIGIIGGVSGIGRWFAAFFEKEGHPSTFRDATRAFALPRWQGSAPSLS